LADEGEGRRGLDSAARLAARSGDRRVNLAEAFHNDAMTFEEKRDAIVALLRNSRWVTKADECGRLREIVDNLAAGEDAEEFDGWWDEFYDEAGYDRIWIATH